MTKKKKSSPAQPTGRRPGALKAGGGRSFGTPHVRQDIRLLSVTALLNADNSTLYSPDNIERDLMACGWRVVAT